MGSAGVSVGLVEMSQADGSAGYVIAVNTMIQSSNTLEGRSKRCSQIQWFTLHYPRIPRGWVVYTVSRSRALMLQIPIFYVSF